MIKLVNFTISKTNEIKIKKYEIDGEIITLYDPHKLALIDSDLDLDQELGLIPFKDIPFPVIVPREQAEELIKKLKEQSESEKVEKESIVEEK